jgi:hypothetical protein
MRKRADAVALTPRSAPVRACPQAATRCGNGKARGPNASAARLLEFDAACGALRSRP